MKKLMKIIVLLTYVSLLLYVPYSLRYNQSWAHTTKCSIVLIVLAILLGIYTIIDFHKNNKILEADRKRAEKLYEKSKEEYLKIRNGACIELGVRK